MVVTLNQGVTLSDNLATEITLTYVSLGHVVVDDAGQWRRARGWRVNARGGRRGYVVAVRAEGAQVGIPGGSSGGRRVTAEERL